MIIINTDYHIAVKIQLYNLKGEEKTMANENDWDDATAEDQEAEEVVGDSGDSAGK